MRKYSRARCVAIAVACVLASARPAWAAAVCVAPVEGASGEQVERFHRLDQGRWLVETRGGIYQLAEAGARLSPYEGSGFLRISQIAPLNRDATLLFSDRDASGLGGVFRAHHDTLKIQEVNGSEALRFTAVGGLPTGGAIVGTDRGVYRVNAAGAQFQEAPGAETGRVSFLEQIEDGGWLIGAASGLFRFDGRTSRIERLPSGDVGEVTQLQRLAEGGWLAGADKGLFRVDAGARSIGPFPGRKPFRVAEIQKLADGGWLVRGEQGLFLADVPGRRLDVLDEDPGSAWRIQHVDERGAVLQNKKIVYVLPAGAKKVEFVSGESLNDIHRARGVQDGWLLASPRGLFKLDLPRRRLMPLRGTVPGRVASLHPLKNGGHLVVATGGLLRVDPGLQAAEPVSGSAAAGQIASVRPLGSGDFLAAAQNGLFRIDRDGGATTPLKGSKIGNAFAVEPLAAGDWLALGRGAVASVDAEAESVKLIPGGGPTNVGAFVQTLPDGRALIGTSNGVLATVSTLDSATLADAPPLEAWGRSGSEIVKTFNHPCASVADQMGLMVRVANDNSGSEQAARLAPVRVIKQAPTGATIGADPGALGTGRWKLQLVATASGREVPVGKPAMTSVTATAEHWLSVNWPWLLAGLAGVQLLAFGALMVAARRRPGALRALRSGWGRALIWPSFALPRSPTLQRWALSPWFAKEREMAGALAPSVDTMVTGPEGAKLKSAELLARLDTARKIWLQGRTGMGKTTAQAAWRRLFFAESKTLSRAAKRYGFVLVPIPASLVPPAGSGNDAHSTVVDLAAAALERRGAPCDRGWLSTMLRAGRLALAFDSPNDVVRTAIGAVSRAYPKALFLVTSDQASPPGFEAWQLPTRVAAEAMERLLQRDLGAYSGSQLAAELNRNDVLPQLLTYYDVRLVADIVMDNPAHGVPADRVGIYRTPFARAAAREFSAQDLDPLRSLAWTMTLEGRSLCTDAEIAAFDQSTLAVLVDEKSRILRKTDAGYAFDHDQLRFFLAAEHLVQRHDRMASLIATLDGSPVWACERHEQEELWRFGAALLSSEDVTALWRFSLDEPERVYLQCALHKRGLETKVFPIGLGTALSGRDDTAPSSRLRTVEAS